MLTSASGILGVRDAEDRRPDPRQRRRPRRRAADALRRPPSREVEGPRAEARPQGRRHRRLAVRGQRDPQHRAQRRRRQAARGVRHRAHVARRHPQGVLGHPRARQRHEPQRRARLDVLPELRAVLRPAVLAVEGPRHGAQPAARVQRLAHRRVVRHAIPGRFIPLSIPPIWDPQLMADEVRRVAKKGCHAVTFSENPREARVAAHLRRPLGPVLRRVRGRGHGHLPAHRVVVDDARDSSRARRST